MMMSPARLASCSFDNAACLCRAEQQPDWEGYTLMEAGQLARSSLPAHRASACQMLHAVLLSAQRSAASSFSVVRSPLCAGPATCLAAWLLAVPGSPKWPSPLLAGSQLFI